jgi:transposase-like protein
MKTEKRKSPEEKERIIKEIKKMGVVEGCAHFGISAGTYYNWSSQYSGGGIKGLNRVNNSEYKSYIKELEEKSRLMEQLLVEKDLQIKMQQEIIKKNLPLWKKEKR